MIRSDGELQIAVGSQDALQLQNALAGHDNLLARLRLAFEAHLSQGKSMAIRRYRP